MLASKKDSKNNTKEDSVNANLGFENELFKAADSLRKNMDAAEYKHVVLGLIFLKYISDSFEERQIELIKEKKVALILKIKENTQVQRLFGFQKTHAGQKFNQMQRSPLLEIS